MFNLREPVRFFAFDPMDARVIYAGTSGLWRSVDTGRTWNLVYPAPASVTRLIMPDDHASPSIETGVGPAESVTALAVDPSDSKALYAVTGRGEGSALYISKDWGAHWERSAGLGSAPRSRPKIYIDPASPPSDRTIYVITTNSVYVRRGGQWNQGAPPNGVSAFSDATAGFSSSGKLFV